MRGGAGAGQPEAGVGSGVGWVLPASLAAVVSSWVLTPSARVHLSYRWGPGRPHEGQPRRTSWCLNYSLGLAPKAVAILSGVKA